MRVYLELEKATHHVLDFLNARITELVDLPAVEADEVVVLPVTVRFLVERHVIPELVLDHQVAVEQKIKGIVDCCTANVVIFVLHLQVKLLHIKVVVAGINFLQNSEALGSFPLLLLL